MEEESNLPSAGPLLTGARLGQGQQCIQVSMWLAGAHLLEQSLLPPRMCINSRPEGKQGHQNSTQAL